MKFIHTADLHLDSKINSLTQEKAKIRREEILTTFEKLCDYAENNNVTAVIISGDMFDSAKVTNKTFLRVINAIKKAKDTDFLCLSGNHDEENVFYNAENLPINLKFFLNEWTKFTYNNVEIHGISFSNKNISTYADTLLLDKDKINIVALHGQIAGYNSKDDVEVISLPKLKNKNIDYLALGHIHSYDLGELDIRGKYCYSGCLDARGFDELDKKGFVLLEDEQNKLISTFIPFSSREYCELDFNIDNRKNFYDELDAFMSDIKAKINSKNIVKVNIKGEITPNYNIDFDLINSRLNDYFFYSKIKDKTTLKISIEDYKNDKSIVGEFVRTVLSSNLEKEYLDKILLCGLNALNKKEME